jgi:L-threonylcarbamoyladenylate synthase
MNRADVLSIDFDNPSETTIRRAVNELESGGLVVAPTETTYGLLVRADRQEGLKRLYQAKKREFSAPTAIFLADFRDAATYGKINDVALALADAFLPGPLTLVITAAGDWEPPLVVGKKIGIRVSSAPVIKRIVAASSFPITATSANRSGEPVPDSVAKIAELFCDETVLYLDADRRASTVSTVVDCTRNRADIVREGAIDRTRIEEAVGKVNR